MLDLAVGGAGEGWWLRAERQVAGRGRQGRDWVSPVGNFHGSTLVRSRAADPSPATLAFVAAIALDEAVVSLWPEGSTRLAIKWPNDLLLDGAKLAGILIQARDGAAVVGIGVNVAHAPPVPDRATTSLAAADAPVTAAMVAESLAEAFSRWLARWRGEGFAPVRRRWLERAHRVGTALSVRMPDGDAIDGLFDGLDADGALLLRLASGERRVIHAGDVFLL